LTVVVVLPTPPFWFATQKILAMNQKPRQAGTDVQRPNMLIETRPA
jgi:hypothetical protein